MYRSIGWLVVLMVLAGCRQNRSEAGRADQPAVTAGAGGAGFQDREAGIEFEAPRLIPAVRARITETADRNDTTEENFTAFRNGVGALVGGMRNDLHHAGAMDDGTFGALSDSIMGELGGSAGDDVVTISPGAGLAAAPRVERLIRLYEERMRTVAN